MCVAVRARNHSCATQVFFLVGVRVNIGNEERCGGQHTSVNKKKKRKLLVASEIFDLGQKIIFNRLSSELTGRKCYYREH